MVVLSENGYWKLLDVMKGSVSVEEEYQRQIVPLVPAEPFMEMLPSPQFVMLVGVMVGRLGCGLTMRVSVMVLSHPDALEIVITLVPDDVKVIPPYW